MVPPLCTNGSAGYLMQLSVNGVSVGTLSRKVLLAIPILAYFA